MKKVVGRHLTKVWGDTTVDDDNDNKADSKGIVGKPIDYKLEVLSGITVGMALVPEVVAFAIAAGIPASVALNTTWIIALVNTLSGGRPGIACGAAGALAVVLPDLVKNYGMGHVFYATILMGFIQLALGAGNIGAAAKMIPAPCMAGFCNGLAIIIGMAQLNSYKVPSGRRLSGAFGPLTDGKGFVDGIELFYMVLVTATAFLTSVFFPKLSKKVPAALVAIIAASGVEWILIRLALGGETRLVGDISSAGGSWPMPFWFDPQWKDDLPSVSMQMIGEIWHISVVLSAIGLLESCMTLMVVDEVTQSEGNTYQECLSQGLGNVISGVMGGQPGCAMMGQTMINLDGGAMYRLSEGSSSAFVFLVVMVAYPLIDKVPVSALCGVMFNVVLLTMDWKSWQLIAIAAMPDSWRQRLEPSRAASQIRRADAITIVLVTVVSCLTDLGAGVGCGVIFECLAFAKQSSQLVSIRTVGTPSDSVKRYVFNGVLFFGSASRFLDLFQVERDPASVELVFEDGCIEDHTAVEALKKLGERYAEVGKVLTVHLLQPRSKALVLNARTLLKQKVGLVVDVVTRGEDDTAPLSPKSAPSEADLNENRAKGQLIQTSKAEDGKADGLPNQIEQDVSVEVESP